MLLLMASIPMMSDEPHAFVKERQLTHGPFNHDLDDNINFSPDGRYLVFDCRDAGGIGHNRRLGIVNVETGVEKIIYHQPNGESGVGAASFLNDHEIIAIHSLIPQPGLPAPPGYDYTERGGMIISADGSGKRRWLDSRSVIAPFTPGALRGGTHKHDPDGTGQWIGFTYNDAIMKARGTDLRNVGVSKRGALVSVPKDSRNFTGESFSVLLTACVDDPKPGTAEIKRAEGDCWIGSSGFVDADGKRKRARAFRGLVAVQEGRKTAYYSDLFMVLVPTDLTNAGPLGPLQGTETSYPKPPRGAATIRLTHTAQAADERMRGITGHVRADKDGNSIVFIAKAKTDGHIANQVFAFSMRSGTARQITRFPHGVAGSQRISPNGRYVAATLTDKSVAAIGLQGNEAGCVLAASDNRSSVPLNVVVSPDSHLVAYNRLVNGLLQVFILRLP